MAGMDSSDQAGQFMKQLASMRDGLESIRQVISPIAARDEGAEDRMDSKLQLRDGITHTAEQLSQSLEATSQELANQPLNRPMNRRNNESWYNTKSHESSPILSKVNFTSCKNGYVNLSNHWTDVTWIAVRSTEAVMGNYTDVEKAFREGLEDPQLEEDQRKIGHFY